MYKRKSVLIAPWSIRTALSSLATTPVGRERERDREREKTKTPRMYVTAVTTCACRVKPLTKPSMDIDFSITEPASYPLPLPPANTLAQTNKPHER